MVKQAAKELTASTATQVVANPAIYRLLLLFEHYVGLNTFSGPFKTREVFTDYMRAMHGYERINDSIVSIDPSNMTLTMMASAIVDQSHSLPAKCA